MDPMQAWLLEAAYEEFENGAPDIHGYRDTNTPNPASGAILLSSKYGIPRKSSTGLTEKIDKRHLRSFLAKLCGKGEDLVEFYGEIETLVLVSFQRLVKSIDPASFDGNGARTRYWNWAQHHLVNAHPGGQDVNWQLTEANAEIYERATALEKRNFVGRLCVAVAKRLEEFFVGDLTFTGLLMETNLLKNYYEEFTGSPQVLKILELGGGTTSATRRFVETLSDGPDGYTMASIRCDRYDFADVYPAFPENAKQLFADFQAQMTFRALDIERDFEEHGFESGTYDVINYHSVWRASSYSRARKDAKECEESIEARRQTHNAQAPWD
ncbi:hypothetical protein F4861DRAFT_552053 [Xylaria intraflava]|nr:hypothetical protein F4861DRAFT_552053 [Xylaria intraflava]